MSQEGIRNPEGNREGGILYSLYGQGLGKGRGTGDH